MNKEELTKEDILNVTGSVFDTMFGYVDNSNREIKQLQQENEELKQKYLNAVSDYEQEKAKNSRAIEYITNRKPSDIGIAGNNKKYYYQLNEDEVDTLLEILKGDSNE